MAPGKDCCVIGIGGGVGDADGGCDGGGGVVGLGGLDVLGTGGTAIVVAPGILDEPAPEDWLGGRLIGS